MIAIIGLGNPGEQYQNNRHNVGFMFVDFMTSELRMTHHEFKFDKYLNAAILLPPKNRLYATRYALHDFILVKPQTFMNKSGEAVESCITRYALDVTHGLLIVHDDLDIPLGKFKIQKGTGPQLHNGIESIENHLQTKDFWRIRIGVDNRKQKQRIDGETYVLQNFLSEERKAIDGLFPVIYRHPLIVRLLRKPS